MIGLCTISDAGSADPTRANVQSRASRILSVQQMLGGSLGTRVRQLARNYRIHAQRGHMTGGRRVFMKGLSLIGASARG
jgi:hypothetical protein